MICECGWKYSDSDACPRCGATPTYKTGVGMPNQESGRRKRISKVGKARKRRLEQEGSEVEVFLRIWLDRPHRCENMICRKEIHGFSPRCFHHLKTKGAHPELRYEERNIVILCPECHDKAHQQGNSWLVLPELYSV